MIVQKILISLFLLWSVIDRTVSTFTKSSFANKKFQLLAKLYSFFVVLIYTFILIDGYIFFLRRVELQVILPFFGVMIFLVGKFIRDNAIRALGRQWINHSSAAGTRKIINVGPYDYARHPYYWATILDLFAYAMIFQSIRTALLALFVFVPIMIVRIYFEEQSLNKKFGLAYQTYSKKAAYFFSFRRFLYNSYYTKNFLQVLEMIKRFGIGKIFLMSSLKRTISQYSRGYAVSRIVGALIEIKFVESIIREGHVNLKKFCDQRNIDFETLKVLCDYLAVLKLLNKNNLTYSITKAGREVLSDTRGALSLLYAYMPVFEALPDIFMRHKCYGDGVLRRNDFVGVGSNELSAMLPFPFACDIFHQYHLRNILDVGCGAGDFLLNSCGRHDFIGCGIDIAKEAIDIAKKRSAEVESSIKVSFKICDLKELPSRAEEFKKSDVISFMFVLHEFLSSDKEAVVRILSDLREAFPRAKIFIAEIYRLTTPELIKREPPIAEHHLFHKLSKQGLATLSEWRAFFQRAGYIILEEKRLDLAAQVYFLLEKDPRPRDNYFLLEKKRKQSLGL